MGNTLHKLGAFAFKHPWRVIGTWLIVVALLAAAAVQFMTPATGSISIPGTEAQKALDRVGQLFPSAGKGSGRMVFAAPTGKNIDDYKIQIDTAVSEAKKVDGVANVISPFDNPTAMSDDRTIAFAQVQLKGGTGSVTEKTIDGILTIAKANRTNGLVIETGGDLVDNTPGEILGIGEVAGVLLALVVLVMTLGSLIAAGMPVATAIVAVAASMGGLFALSRVVEIGTTTPVLAVMLGLAVGIDYSLFIISKYRHYLLEGYGNQAAAARAIGTAGNAVVFAAATVVIALAALTIVQIPFMTTMGLAGAATIALAALVAITLIPALLGLAGNRVVSRRTRKAIAAAAQEHRHTERTNHRSFWYKWGAAITKHPVIVLVVAVVLLGVIALPARQLRMGLPTDEYASVDTTQRRAYDLLTKGFGPGFNGPLVVVAENLPAVSDADRQVVRDQMMQEFQRQTADAAKQAEAAFAQQAAQATTPAAQMALQQQMAQAQQAGQAKQAEALKMIDQKVGDYAKFVQLKKVADKIAARGDVQQALPGVVTDDGTKGVIQIIPKSAPSDQATSDLIAYLRDRGNWPAVTGDSAVTLAVTGATALQNDINAKLAAALPLYLSVVVGLSLLLLVVAFRSVLVPVKATLGFLLSVLAMFGALVAVFQWGWFGIAEAPGPIVSFIPIIAIGILFGLAMDYEFFLVSSMHEAHSRGVEAKKAVVEGFGLGSKVVAAAGIIMVAVFAGFITNHDTTIQAVGFGLAVGIFVDAFIVRMTIVPVVMTLLGRAAWWLPGWLNRVIPQVSIEGEESKKS